MSFRRQIALSYLLLVGLCIGLPGNLYLEWYRDYQIQERVEELNQHAEFLAGLLRARPMASLASELKDLSLTLRCDIEVVEGAGFLHFTTRQPHRGDHRTELTPPLREALQGRASHAVLAVPPQFRTSREPELISTLVVAVPIRSGRALCMTRSLLDLELHLLELQTLLLEAVLVSLALAAVAGYVLSNWLMRPLKELGRQARALSAGETRAVSISSPQEMEELAREFNQMASALQRKNESMSRFLGDASHELKTPLASLAALADAVEVAAQDDPERVPRLTEVMRDEALRLGGLVDSLLTLHRLESRPELRLKSTCLLALARDCAAQMESLEPPIPMEVTGQALEVSADRNALKQVVLNLLSNARRAVAQEVKPHIIIRVKERGSVPVLEVEDNGVGLSKVEAARVFERFYRVDEARARKDGGHGLGLAIASRILACHGGRLEVESELGKGSVFSCLFRASTRPHQESASDPS